MPCHIIAAPRVQLPSLQLDCSLIFLVLRMLVLLLLEQLLHPGQLRQALKFLLNPSRVSPKNFLLFLLLFFVHVL